LELALEFVTIVDESFVQIACDVAINLTFWEKRNFDEILFIGLYNELWTIYVCGGYIVNSFLGGPHIIIGKKKVKFF